MTDPTPKDHSEAERPTVEGLFEQWYSDWCSNICQVDPKFKDHYRASFYHAYLFQKDHYQPIVERLTKEVEDLKIKLHKAEGAFEGQRHRALDIQTQCGNIMEHQKQVIEAAEKMEDALKDLLSAVVEQGWHDSSREAGELALEAYRQSKKPSVGL